MSGLGHVPGSNYKRLHLYINDASLLEFDPRNQGLFLNSVPLGRLENPNMPALEQSHLEDHQRIEQNG